MRYHSVNKNEIITFECKWMDLENMILNEVTQIEKKNAFCSFISSISISTPHATMTEITMGVHAGGFLAGENVSEGNRGIG